MFNLKIFLEIIAGLQVMVSMIPLLEKEFWVSRNVRYPLMNKILVSLIILIFYCVMLFVLKSHPGSFDAELTLLGVYTCSGLSILLRVWQKG